MFIDARSPLLGVFSLFGVMDGAMDVVVAALEAALVAALAASLNVGLSIIPAGALVCAVWSTLGSERAAEWLLLDLDLK
jgi:hypothetical protein